MAANTSTATTTTATVDDPSAAADNIVTEYATYESYLDSQITQNDLFYLEDEELARQLVELGYRGSGEVIKREEFEQKKELAAANKQSIRDQKRELSHVGKNNKWSALQAALAEREEDNRTGKMSTIIFVRDRNPKGQEISGYIDYAHRLNTEDFEPFFSGRKKLLPRPTDLSFFNWDTNSCTSNSSPNFEVIADCNDGLIFKNLGDRKIIDVDPKAETPGDNTIRIELNTSKYAQVVLYDHVARRKT